MLRETSWQERAERAEAQVDRVAEWCDALEALPADFSVPAVLVRSQLIDALVGGRDG